MLENEAYAKMNMQYRENASQQISEGGAIRGSFPTTGGPIPYGDATQQNKLSPSNKLPPKSSCKNSIFAPETCWIYSSASR